MNRPQNIPANYIETEPGVWVHPSRLKTYAKHCNPVGAVLPPKPEQNTLPALDNKPKVRGKRKTSLVARITFIRCGRKLLDDDNLAACFKGMRDAVAARLGIDDSIPAIQWRYQQLVTEGEVGTIVKMEAL